MKTLKSILTTACVVFFITDAVYAQEGIAYVVEQNRSAFSILESRVADRGISSEEFGAWLAEGSGISIQAVDRRSDPGPAFPMGSARITLFIVSERGIVGQNGMPVRLSDQSTSLGRLVDGGQMGRFIDSTVKSLPSNWVPNPEDWHPNPENWHPTPDNWTPDPADWFPDPANWSPIQSSHELQRIASEVGQRDVGSGGGAGKATFVLMIAPDADRYEVPVTPGAAVYTFDLKK